MIVARNSGELGDAFNRAAATAREAFGDDTLYIERYVEHARHLEVQAMGDGTGRIVHFGERDCSLQRRYQKMIEEAPASVVPEDVRVRLRAAAVDLLGSINYRNAGTVEFLYDAERQEFSFMEVNARIQVEHPVSEQITRTDLIKMQLEVATQQCALPAQSTIEPRGHAIEARILAEDPANNFSPSPGRITHWRAPTGAGVRVDTGFGAGSMVPPFYDSMIAKLIVYGRNRDEAVERLIRALANFEVQGIATNLPLLIAIATHDDFRSNDISTRWLEATLLPSFASSG